VTVSDLSESDLIARIQSFLPPAPPWVVVGIGDDAAVVEPAKQRLEVLSVDAIVEGVHFDRRFTPPDAIGHRALAVNLSDLASMGAAPRLALLSLALPGALPADHLDAIVRGLAALAARHSLHVVGGNLTRSPGPLVIDVTVMGVAKRRQILTRSGARVGDEIWVTGRLGGAAAGLDMLASGAPDPAPSCVERYLYPEPRLRAGLMLGRNRAATACMDLSDGLGDAVRQVARASKVGAVIDGDSLPVEPEAVRWFAARGDDPVVAAVSRGDDYELLVTARPRARRLLDTLKSSLGVPFTRIGVCTDGDTVLLERGAKRGAAADPLPAGFDHFHQS
jgi:thiamine-monophosphate kinase